MIIKIQRVMTITIMTLALLLAACSNLHDGQGWEHDPDSDAHQDSSSIFEHKH